MLDSLPTELVHEVFNIACTDGGRTAAALRLVSRQMSSVAEEHRFQSLVIVGSIQLTKVEAALRSVERPSVVDRMFFRDDGGRSTRKMSDQAENAMISDSDSDGNCESRVDDIFSNFDLLTGFAQLLKDHVAANLKVLTVVLSFAPYFSALDVRPADHPQSQWLSCSFPRLECLTFLYHPPLRINLVDRDSIQMPNLTTLRITHSGSTKKALDFLQLLAGSCPKSLHLHLMNMSLLDQDVSTFCKVLLGEDTPLPVGLSKPFRHITVHPIWPVWRALRPIPVQSSERCTVMPLQEESQDDEWKDEFYDGFWC
jgi:hypothetical protein